MATNRSFHIGPLSTSLWIVIALITGAAIAGCGPGGGSHASRVPNYAFRFARCMRANGVHNFPDPGPNGIQFNPSSGMNPASPAYQHAQSACKKYLPSSKPPRPIPEGVRRELLALAKCMRANGVPNFPDPGPNGIQFPVGDPILQSPAFQRAENGRCKKYGAHGS